MKQTFLDFEQPIAELQQKIDELRFPTGEPLAFEQHGGVLEQGLLRLTLPPAYCDALLPVIKLTFA